MNRRIILGVVIMITLGIAATTSIVPFTSHEAQAVRRHPTGDPVVISGNNIYVAWWTNNTGNDEVMFRASNDVGHAFGDKINLSNSTDESGGVNIDADGDNVVVTWWESNASKEQPVMRVSNDNGETFGPLLQLAANGTLGE